MNFYETMIFYAVVGLATATAYAATDRTTVRWQRSGALLGAWLFWPLFVPLILSNRSSSSPTTESAAPPVDDLASGIEQVQRELDAALAGLDGWAEGVLNRNSARLRELRAALVAQAARIREMETVLQNERQVPPDAEVHVDEAGSPPTEAPREAETTRRRERSRQARQENLNRLKEVCRRSRSEMLATFAWIRELVSMIQLAKFTGAPADRAEELVAQIAAAVESLSAESAAASSRRETSRLPVILQAGKEEASGRNESEQRDT